MKKLLALSILVGIFASAAFAESSISITGSAEAALTPLQIVSNSEPDDTYIGAGLGRPWDPQGPMVQLKAAADYEGILGAKVDLQFYYGQTNPVQFGIGDFAELWLKPVDWFKLDVGRFNENILRGKIGDDDWSLWTVAMGGKDDIFTRFKGMAGALVAFTPVKGLYIGAMIPKLAQFGSDTDPFFTEGRKVNDKWIGQFRNDDGASWRAYRVYERIQAAVGYEIEGIGLARVQFVGANPGIFDSNGDPMSIPSDPADFINVDSWSAPRFEGAFAYTGMEGLVIDFGFKVYLPISDWTTNEWNSTDEKYNQLENTPSFWNPVFVSLGADFTSGNIGIAARIDLNFLGSVTYEVSPTKAEVGLPFGLNFHLWPSYNLGFGIIGLDFGLAYTGEKSLTVNDNDQTVATFGEKQGGIDVGFGAWFKKPFGNSSIKLGLACRIGTEKDGDKQPLVFSVPIVLDYSF